MCFCFSEFCTQNFIFPYPAYTHALYLWQADQPIVSPHSYVSQALVIGYWWCKGVDGIYEISNTDVGPKVNVVNKKTDVCWPSSVVPSSSSGKSEVDWRILQQFISQCFSKVYQRKGEVHNWSLQNLHPHNWSVSVFFINVSALPHSWQKNINSLEILGFSGYFWSLEFWFGIKSSKPGQRGGAFAEICGCSHISRMESCRVGRTDKTNFTMRLKVPWKQ